MSEELLLFGGLAIVVVIILLYFIFSGPKGMTVEYVDNKTCNNGVCTEDKYVVCNGVKCGSGQDCVNGKCK